MIKRSFIAYRPVQYYTVQYSTAQYRTVQYVAVQYSTRENKNITTEKRQDGMVWEYTHLERVGRV